MVDIRPFRAIRYTERAGDPENLITQPYDKIDPAMQKEYYRLRGWDEETGLPRAETLIALGLDELVPFCRPPQ